MLLDDPLKYFFHAGPSLPVARRSFAGMANDGDKILLLGGAGLQDEYSNDILSWKNGADEWKLEEIKLSESKENGPQALKIQSENLNC